MLFQGLFRRLAAVEFEFIGIVSQEHEWALVNDLRVEVEGLGRVELDGVAKDLEQVRRVDLHQRLLKLALAVEDLL